VFKMALRREGSLKKKKGRRRPKIRPKLSSRAAAGSIRGIKGEASLLGKLPGLKKKGTYGRGGSGKRFPKVRVGRSLAGETLSRGCRKRFFALKIWGGLQDGGFQEGLPHRCLVVGHREQNSGEAVRRHEKGREGVIFRPWFRKGKSGGVLWK